MYKWILFGLLLVAAAVYAEDEIEEAQACDPEACQLPDCRCSSTAIPGGLNPRDVPQFVTVTFDDAITVLNIVTYRNTLYGRRNKNNCPAQYTFYVSHEYTDYALVNELYNNGYEIALHSISHLSNLTYWAEATYETMVQEFVDQRTLMSHFANIPPEAMTGVRLPFLQMSGDSSFQMMAAHDLKYDSSWPTITFTNPALWPYTLNYRSTQECTVPPCPTASIPGPWVMPMVAWSDLDGVPCSFVDACRSIPDYTDEEGWYQFILTNFERHYTSNRAPFPFFVHEGFIRAYPAVQAAFVRFLDLLNNLEDVYLVTAQEVLEWVKDPVPIPEYRQKPCRSFVPSICNRVGCELTSHHSPITYYMQSCRACPRVYPWVGNPLGL